MAAHDSRPSADRLEAGPAGSAFLAVNSAYLAAFATPSLFYYTNVALHAFVGVVWRAARSGAPEFAWTRTCRARGGTAARCRNRAGRATIPGVSRYRWLLLRTSPSRRSALGARVVRPRSSPGAQPVSDSSHCRRAAARLGGLSTAMRFARAPPSVSHRQSVGCRRRMEGEGGGPQSPFFPSSRRPTSAASSRRTSS